MATLAADTPQTYQGSKIEIEDYEVLGGSAYQGSILVEHTSVGNRVLPHAAETAGFAGIADGGGVNNDVITVKAQGFWEGSINVTVAGTDKGSIVYVPANSTNPADSNLTSASNLPWGKIHRVLATGALGTNRVVIFFQADSLRSI